MAGNGTCGSSRGRRARTAAELWDPGALAVDAGGNVLVADQGNRTIRVLAATTGSFYGVAIAADHLGTVAGEGSYGPYLIDGLSAVGRDRGAQLPDGASPSTARATSTIADGAMHAIRFVPAVTTTLRGQPAQAGDMYTAAGAMATGPLRNRTAWIQTRLLDPVGLAVSPAGQLIYSDNQADVVRELPAGT